MEREQELDVDLPDLVKTFSSNRDDWEYTPPDRDYADVKEVWFGGDLTLADAPAVTYNVQVPIQTLSEAPILRSASTPYHTYHYAG